VEDPAWGCLGLVNWSPLTVAKVTIHLTLAELLTGKPPVSVTARLCSAYQIASCSTILDGAPVFDSMYAMTGRVTATVDADFKGYLEIAATTASNGVPEFVPALIFMPPHLTEGYFFPTTTLLPPEALTSFSSTVASSIDPNLGHLLLQSYDCSHQAASGVQVDVDNRAQTTRRFYIRSALPSKTAEETDTSGQAGFINLSPGPITITGKRASNEHPIGTTTGSIRAGSVGYMIIEPTPALSP
jgi:hypothetical protein